MTLLPMEWRMSLVLAVVSLLLYCFFKIMSIYSYFKNRGIPYIKPVFLLGSDVQGALGKKSIADVFDRIYKALNGEKVGGCFLGVVPVLMVRDPEFVNNLLTTNFENFHDRPFLIDEKTNPLEAHVFFFRGYKWKFLRNKFSPVFTAGKMKYLYEEMAKCSDILMEHMEKHAVGKDFDMHDTFTRFATDVIGSIAFGLEPETLKNPDSKFRKMGKRYLEQTLISSIYLFLRFAAPKFLVSMKVRMSNKEVVDYFMTVMKKVLDHRRKNAVNRKDFVQLALQLKESGHIEGHSADVENEVSTKYSNQKDVEKIEITDDLLAAQAFVFYVGGFETTSLSLNFLVYELSIHPDIQDKVREEIRRVKQKYGSLSYESLNDLVYLDKCIAEMLRLFPTLPYVNRECTRDCTLMDGTKIEKGVHVMVPILSLHRDPEYFPDPDEFRPDRFDKPPVRGTYIPFGDGPRSCLGKRFAMLEIKVAIANLFDRYRFEESSLTKTPVEFAATLTLNPLNPLWVKISKLEE